MASDDPSDFKALYLKEKERRLQAEEQRLQAEERNRLTNFEEFIRACHSLLSLPARAQVLSKSTRGSIGKPAGKLCPANLRCWASCPEIQEKFYRRVCNYFPSTDKLFSPVIALEDIGRKYCHRPLGGEKDLEFYERLAVEQHVNDVITELCKIPDARNEFALGEGVEFENHANTIDEDDPDTQSNAQRSIPDQFCVHRLDDGISTLLTTVEYKPPHKLSVEYLRVGLRPMNIWKEVVQRETIPTENNAKSIYIAEQVTASALVQEYHVMINEGLEFSYVTNGLAYVLLHVRDDDPSTLYYYLCEPNMDVDPRDDLILQQPKTAITRVLCLCLMSCFSLPRDHGWRNDARKQLRVWETNIDYVRAQIPKEVLRQTPPGSEYAPSSPLSSPTPDDHKSVTRSQAGCAPAAMARHSDPMDSSDSDSHQAAPGRKRNLSQLTSSPPSQRLSHQRGNPNDPKGHRQHTTKFCTQRCLLGLQRGDSLDENCPNVEAHRRRKDCNRHAIDVERLVDLLKQQLDKSLDHNCTPLGICGSYGAPFKITCSQYGYTVVGKGTTSFRWNEVSGEAVIYRVLREAQGSAVPVFLGTIDLRMIYFLHGAGEIKHMLLMGWGGEDTSKLEHSRTLLDQIERSKNEVRALGVYHQDFRFENILWNVELGRALIIDFHRSKLVYKSAGTRKSLKRLADETHLSNAKRIRTTSRMRSS